MNNLHNLKHQDYSVTMADRAVQKSQKPCVIWFTGLSGAGKSTIAGALEAALFKQGHHTYVLDGDNVRHGLTKDLGFSDADRIENIRRVGEVSKLMLDAGLIVLTAFISPFRDDRQMARQMFEADEFIEVHVSTPLSVCESRDSKGLYEKARAGKIQNFTGIDSAYEPPESAEVTIDTSKNTLEESVDSLVMYLQKKRIIA